MLRLLNTTFFNIHEEELLGDALVEFIRYDEDGKIVNEVTAVYLPEFVPATDEATLKTELIKRFHNGEGYNL